MQKEGCKAQAIVPDVVVELDPGAIPIILLER